MVLHWHGTNISGNEQDLDLHERGGAGHLGTVNIPIPTNTWLRYVIEFGDTVTVTVYNDETDTELGSVSGETTKEFGHRGIGFGSGAKRGEQWYDGLHVR